ncbi:MAG: hypothetical protein V2I43_10280, partial [Parvularcula sp.]|nr:hypothetical protein [Parvularcula sp.]
MARPVRIAKITRIPVPALGPEDAVVAPDGTVYSALRNDGWLLKVPPGGTEAERVCHLGGRGLG